MQIRDALPSDKATVLDFCKDTFSWGDYISDVWDSWISQGKLLVIDERNTPIGICHLIFLTNKSQVWIEGIRIHPKYRRRGYASKLILHAQSIAQNESCKMARMIIESENNASIKLVKSLGYYIEDKWRLYYLAPQRQGSATTVAYDTKQVGTLLSSNTYTDSWKWIPLDKSEIEELIKEKRVLVSMQDGVALATGIWNESVISPKVLQLGLINGTKKGMQDILRFMQNKAHESGSERIQIFTPEKIRLQMKGLNKGSLFYLMKKDLD